MSSKISTAPWTGFDVLLIFALWFFLQITCGYFARYAGEPIQNEQTNRAIESDNGHPLAQLILQKKQSPGVLLFAFLAAAVIVPIAEEFLFRMLLQSWLETKFNEWNVLYSRVSAILAVSLFFAAIHGGKNDSWNVQTLIFLFAAITVCNLIVFAFGMVYLIRKYGRRICRYFFGTGRFFNRHFFHAAAFCFAALFLIYVLTAILGIVFRGENISPIPIFLFAVLLGTLYSRTQNLLYCIGMHACLNGISFALVLMM